MAEVEPPGCVSVQLIPVLCGLNSNARGTPTERPSYQEVVQLSVFGSFDDASRAQKAGAFDTAAKDYPAGPAVVLRNVYFTTK
jgi:hypothetical protein